MDKASVISSDTHNAWTEFVSDKLKNKLFELKSDNGIVPLGTVDEIVQLFVNDIEKLGNTLKEMKDAAADMGLKWHDYDAGEDAWEDERKGRWVKRD